jgi:hypothetical protein
LAPTWTRRKDLKTLLSGANRACVEELKEEFLRDHVFFIIKANRIRGRVYLV